MASDAKACFSSKVEYCGIIQYLYLRGKTGKEIHGKLANVYAFLHHLKLRLNSVYGNSNAGLDPHWMPPM